MFNLSLFYSHIRKSLFKGKLKPEQFKGCEKIVAEWQKRGIEDKRILAYILATVFHETDKTMQPIKEYGNADYFEGRYGPNGSKPELAKELGNDEPGDGAKYHGRGYVMITGKANYRRFGARYGFNLVANPDLALEPETAINILFDGMLNGLFTGQKLSDYIYSKRVDYKGSRRVVNGQDRSNKIAKYAQKFKAAMADKEDNPILFTGAQGAAVSPLLGEMQSEDTVVLQPRLLASSTQYSDSDEPIIKGKHGDHLVLSPQAIKRIVLVNCSGVTLDLRHVTFTPNHNKHIPLVEIRGGQDNKVINVNYHQNYEGWSVNDWEQARNGVLVGGVNNQVENISLQGVRFGVQLVGVGAKAKYVNVIGFSYDGIRMTANSTELDTAVIEDAFLANADNHSDAIQLFPQADPTDMYKLSLRDIKVKNVRIANSRNKPGGTWLQGVFLTDGRIIDSHFSNIQVNSDHQHGLSLTEAHDCTLDTIRCYSPNEEVVSHISVNTTKEGYKASRKVRMQKCNADLILIN